MRLAICIAEEIVADGVLCIFGLGEQKIISENSKTIGRITNVKKCWWLKINTKSIRTHTRDGAKFPAIISFDYFVEGMRYKGKRYVSWRRSCPHIGEEVVVFYDKGNPDCYAVRL